MKSLIIHPKDSSTDFLKPIYAPIPDKTIIRCGINKIELKKLIDDHDRILMLGHGSPNGLLSVGQFPDAGVYIIDESFVESLSKKTNNIFIWCHADLFVRGNGLNGFYTGMFISEIQEAWDYNFYDLGGKEIDESNERFSSIVSRYINLPQDLLYKNVIQEYGLLAHKNPIVKFNVERVAVHMDTKDSICHTAATYS